MQMRVVGGDDLVARALSFTFLVSLCMFSASIGQVADEKHPTKVKFLGDYFLAYGAIALLCSILKSIRLAINEPKYMSAVRVAIPFNLLMILAYGVMSIAKVSLETQFIVYLSVELTVVSFNFYILSKSKVHVHPEYMNERTGVFVIVMLGEIVAAIVSAHGNTTGTWSDNAASSIMAGAVVFGIWWLYFEAVPNPDVYNHSTRTTFSWLVHFGLFFTISVLSGSLVVVLTACDANGLDTEIPHHVSKFLLYSFAIVHLCLKLVGLLYCWDGHIDRQDSGKCLRVTVYVQSMHHL